MQVDMDYGRAIPLGKPMAGWKDQIIDTRNPAFEEPLVAVGPYSDYPEIASDGIYAGERETSPYAPGELKGALVTAFMRKGVAERLVQASHHLPPRCLFMTLDPLRTESVQASLFENFKNQLLEHPFGFSENEAVEKTQQFVSFPSREHSPHMTGGAVDLTLLEFKSDGSWKEYRCLTEKLIRAKADGLDEADIRRFETLIPSSACDAHV